jgi:hypothetical protein
MRPALLMSLLLISCNRLSQSQADSFLNKIHKTEPNILLIDTAGLIPGNAKFIPYPYWDTVTVVPLTSLIDTRKRTFLFYLGKYSITACDICMSEEIASVKGLSKAANIPVLFITDNRNSREMAVFRNRHNLDNLFIFMNPGRGLAQYDNICFVAPIN